MSEEATTRKLCYYRPKLFGMRKRYDTVRVFGSCNGLLCVADNELRTSSSIDLLNPVIRKAKKIPLEACGPGEDADLCLGYFHDDYKVIKIAPIGGDYRVDIYSLKTDSWKTITCHSDYVTFDYEERLVSKYVGGVAYFLNYEEACGDSLALVVSSDYGEILAMWVLRNCGATNTNTFTWEMKVELELKMELLFIL
ncbi:hypothetical protein AgCh_035930 [Apium graveolens]